MQIKSAEFIISNSDVLKCPQENLPEYAFIGRSNVGKSSLINSLLQRKNLAKTSGRPGKTQLINHFKINKNWFLVDLPGYGYAKVSKKQKRIFQKFITDYFSQRSQLIMAFVLIDCRHEPQPVDMDFIHWMGSNGIPFSIVFTKADKLKPKVLEKNVENYLAVLSESWEELPPHFITSSTLHSGREDILEYIDKINASL